jgi:hypothetical protein
MSKNFNCPSCSAPMTFDGGESIFQTCAKCNAPIVVPADIFYDDQEQRKLASDNFASLINDRPVDVEQVTNELTPGDGLPKDGDTIDPEARIEKFEVYQEKIGTAAAETKKAVDEIVAPPKDAAAFDAASPYRSPFEDREIDFAENTTGEATSSRSVIARIQHELRTGDKIEAIKIFRATFGVGLKEAKDAVDALERGETIDISGFR